MLNVMPNAVYSVVEGSIPPKRGKALNAGLDLCIQETTTLQPGETRYCRAGVRFELPTHCYVNVMTRSSTFKRGIIVVPTVIDANYKDEISTIVTNTSNRPVTIERGCRLAQCVLHRWYMFENEDVESLDFSDRDSHQKFGSSGE